MKKSYSVEILHVYSDEVFNEEHRHGANAALTELRTLSEDYSTVMLIDNYNPENKDFDLASFMLSAKNSGVAMDHVAFEADLVDYYSTVLAMMPNNKFRRRYEKYVAKNNKIPCSFLTAIWYLLRLGLLPYKEGMVTSCTGRAFEPAERLINILPERFSPTEEKAIAIIEQTPHRAALEKIKNVYHHSPKMHHPSLSSVELIAAHTSGLLTRPAQGA